MEAALAADNLGAGCDSEEEKESFGNIANELLTLSFTLYEQESAKDMRIQRPCVTSMIGTLMACRSLGTKDYESRQLALEHTDAHARTKTIGT